MNLTPDSASDLEAGIQESCSGIIHFNILLFKCIIMSSGAQWGLRGQNLLFKISSFIKCFS